MRFTSSLFRLGISLSVIYAHFAHAAFNPREYSKQTANCRTTIRGTNEAVDLSLRYVDINPSAKDVILMVHGWPGLWSTWSHQIEEFKDDYHLVVPDLRGFGASTHPGSTRASASMIDLVGDLICVLESAGVREAVCMGHDWGSQLCYEAARLRPDVFNAVVGIVVPYMPSKGPFTRIQDLMPALPRLAYQLYFDDKLDGAVAELNKDIRRTIRATLRTVASPPPDAYLRSVDSFLGAYNNVKEIPPVPFMTQDEEDYMIEQYAIQGFENTLQFYMHENRYATWKFVNEQGNFTLPQPVLAVYPTGDPVANWVLAARLLKSHDFIPHLTQETIQGAHWVHIEFPDQFNGIARKWLDNLRSGRRVVDEL